MQIDITNIIEMARADKEAKVKAVNRINEVNAEIKALEKEREELYEIANSGFYMPKWRSNLLAMVEKIIEKQADKEQ